MENQNTKLDRNGSQPILDSGNSTVIELAGNEDVTVRPLRACLARLIIREDAVEGLPPSQRPESPSPDQNH